MLQTLFLGFAPGPAAERQDGVGPFIQYFLRYRPLLLRLGAAAVPWGLCELLQWRFGAGLAFLAVEIYASLLLMRCLADVLQWEHLGRILAATWPPIAVILVAFYLLFVNDQGQELGVGLMDRNQKGIYLGLALVYWAWNTWLSAKIGLTKCFPEPEKDQKLLFWGPRLLGVCAHLLAAFSLLFAASSQPDLHPMEKGFLMAVAPAAIVLATAFSWLLDKAHISERYRGDERRPRIRKWMYGVGLAELLLMGALLHGMLFDRSPAATGHQQSGLNAAAFWITISALSYLIGISFLRKKAPLGKDAAVADRAQDQRDEQLLTDRLTIGLALVLLLATVTIWIIPMRVGQFVGSLTIASFSFGAVLALVNFLELIVGRLTRFAGNAGFDHLQPRAVWTVMLGFLVLPAFLASSTHQFHRVRICKDAECTPVANAGWAAIEKPAGRPSVSEAAIAWYKQAEPVYHALHPDEPVPMLIVATAGGGIRAAYWTATILEKLESDLRGDAIGRRTEGESSTENLLRNLLFAISGVSGGSVGAAAYVAAVHNHEVSGAAIAPTSYLNKDFLAPGLASLFFIDGPANVLPDFGQIDRGQALELGFESASQTDQDRSGLVSHKFLSFFPTMAEVERIKSWRPALLLNATHLKTGRRIIASHIKIERDAFLNSYDALQILDSDVRLSTAAHNSARFTYVSPAGDLVGADDPHRNKGYVIDGGYFENFGAETALELARKAIEAINESREIGPDKVKLVLVQISSDPTLSTDGAVVRVQRDKDQACAVSAFGKPGSENYLNLDKNAEEGLVFSPANELSAPLVGVMAVRGAHGAIAAAELALESCLGKDQTRPNPDVSAKPNSTGSGGGKGGLVAARGNNAWHFSHLAMCEKSAKGGDGFNPPLGWVLSDQTRGKFEGILSDCGNGPELAALENALGVQVAK